MFRDVPECSGMFHVPNFIDAASVQGFALKQPNIFSDHSQIVCWIKIGTDLSNNNNNFQDICSKIHCSDDILSLLLLFESTKFDLSSTDVENATNQFTNIMTEAAKRSLKLLTVAKTNPKESQLLRNGLIMIAKL